MPEATAAILQPWGKMSQDKRFLAEDGRVELLKEPGVCDDFIGLLNQP